MVPRCETRSSSFMPMPVSPIVRRLVLLVQFQINSRRERQSPIGIIGERQVAELIQRVRGIGNELAQKDFRMRIQGVDDQLEQLTDFGLKFTFRHR